MADTCGREEGLVVPPGSPWRCPGQHSSWATFLRSNPRFHRWVEFWQKFWPFLPETKYFKMFFFVFFTDFGLSVSLCVSRMFYFILSLLVFGWIRFYNSSAYDSICFYSPTPLLSCCCFSKICWFLAEIVFGLKADDITVEVAQPRSRGYFQSIKIPGIESGS